MPSGDGERRHDGRTESDSQDLQSVTPHRLELQRELAALARERADHRDARVLSLHYVRGALRLGAPRRTDLIMAPPVS